MAVTKAKKAEQIEKLNQDLQKASSMIVGTFSKLTVAKDYQLRRAIRSAGARYQVVKNTLARGAAEGTQVSEVLKGLKGVASIGYTSGDPVALAKALSKYVEDNPAAVSKHLETLDEIQQTIRDWFGDSPEHEPLTFSWNPELSGLSCFISHKPDLKLRVGERWLLFEMRDTSLELNLDRFIVDTVVEENQFCLYFKPDPEPEHRFLSSALQEIAQTKHPAFQSRILRTFIELEESLPQAVLEQATGAPTDFLVALEALTSAPPISQIEDDALLAAKLRGLKRKMQMLKMAGGVLSSEQVAQVLGISRQAVDKRRSSNQLLALTQGRRGYSYPAFQFQDGKTINGLEEVLAQLKALDPWMQMVFFTSENERLGGKTPIESLQAGLMEEVKAVANGYGEQGAL